MRKTLLVGAGGHARSIISAAQSIAVDIHGIIDLSYKGQNENILGCPVVGDLDYLTPLPPDEFCIFLSIGENDLRRKTFHEIRDLGFEFPNIIHEKSCLDENVSVGIGNFFGAGAYLGPACCAGSFNIINTNSVVEHEVTMGDFNHVAPSATICGRVSIGDDCLIGANSAIIDKQTVPDGTIIGAGAVVVKSPHRKGLTLKGVPAR